MLQPHIRLNIAPTHIQKHFSNMRSASKGYTRENILLFPAMIVQGPESVVSQPRSPTLTLVADEIVYKERGDSVERDATTATSLDAEQSSCNINRTQFTAIPNDPFPQGIGSGSSPKHQDTILGDIPAQTRFGVESLETDLKQTKKTYGVAYTKLIKKVKKLEKIVKSSQARRRARIVISNDDDDLEDPSKQRRKIVAIDQRFRGDVSTVEPVSTAGAAVTTASVDVSTVSPIRNTRVSTADDITMAETLVYIRKSVAKDKGKCKMTESKPVQTKTKLQQEQERLDFEAAVRLQAELDEEERQRIVRVHEAASSFNVEEWEDIQARVQADEELVQRLQAEEREKYTEAEQARMLAELINQRKRYFAAQRAKERRNKPPTQAQQRTYMSNYIKHMGGYTLQQLRGYSFDEIKILFETTMRSVNTFIPIESEVDRAVPELAAGKLTEELRDKEADELRFTLNALESTGRSSELEIILSLVKEKFNSTEPTDDKEREIWVELKRLFKPEKGMDIYILVEKEYPLSRGTLTLMLVAKILVDQDNEMSRELLRKIFMQDKRLRR
ncbi:hypothetical protein Tco_1016848 [Tanacetum coccineum]|uniref:Uncharacterized protein n=1 Tax=Tanacetum coccineum TaxID=301880 RepID=A0ABQ5FPU4_9ASTR